MTGPSDVEKLEMRIKELENALKEVSAGRAAANVTAEEMQAYLKVRAALDVDFCGVNDCMVFRCIRACVRTCALCDRFCIRNCINECNCGPCSGFGGGGMGGGFGGIGD